MTEDRQGTATRGTATCKGTALELEARGTVGEGPHTCTGIVYNIPPASVPYHGKAMRRRSDPAAVLSAHPLLWLPPEYINLAVLHRARAVSHQWRDIVSTAPMLFSIIDFDGHHYHLDAMALRRTLELSLGQVVSLTLRRCHRLTDFGFAELRQCLRLRVLHILGCQEVTGTFARWLPASVRSLHVDGSGIKVKWLPMLRAGSHYELDVTDCIRCGTVSHHSNHMKCHRCGVLVCKDCDQYYQQTVVGQDYGMMRPAASPCTACGTVLCGECDTRDAICACCDECWCDSCAGQTDASKAGTCEFCLKENVYGLCLTSAACKVCARDACANCIDAGTLKQCDGCDEYLCDFDHENDEFIVVCSGCIRSLCDACSGQWWCDACDEMSCFDCKAEMADCVVCGCVADMCANTQCSTSGVKCACGASICTACSPLAASVLDPLAEQGNGASIPADACTACSEVFCPDCLPPGRGAEAPPVHWEAAKRLGLPFSNRCDSCEGVFCRSCWEGDVHEWSCSSCDAQSFTCSKCAELRQDWDVPWNGSPVWRAATAEIRINRLQTEGVRHGHAWEWGSCESCEAMVCGGCAANGGHVCYSSQCEYNVFY